jgi:hypothetical protein
MNEEAMQKDELSEAMISMFMVTDCTVDAFILCTVSV